MAKGLFTSLEEIKFQGTYIAPIARPGIKKQEKFKPLFTSPEEITFHHNYIKGHVEKAYDPNTRKNPASTKHLCAKKQSRKSLRTFYGHTR